MTNWEKEVNKLEGYANLEKPFRISFTISIENASIETPSQLEGSVTQLACFNEVLTILHRYLATTHADAYASDLVVEKVNNRS